MSKNKLFLLAGFLTISFSVNGQSIVDLTNTKNDSIVINKVNEFFVEVKSLRHILRKSYAPAGDTVQIKKDKADNVLSGVYISESYIPAGPKLKNGVVIIKDKDNSVIRMKCYSDSIQVLTEDYENHILVYQNYFSPIDSTSIEKYYFKDGRLQLIDFFDPKTGDKKIEYSESGEIISHKKY